MELVIDSNVVFSSIISSKGKTRRLMFFSSLKLHAPELLLEEIEKHRKEIQRKSGFSEEEFDLALSLIFSRINFIESKEFEHFIPLARKVCPDPNDTEFFALALSKDIALWSNDKALKKQDEVKVFSTTELLEKFGKWKIYVKKE